MVDRGIITTADTSGIRSASGIDGSTGDDDVVHGTKGVASDTRLTAIG